MRNPLRSEAEAYRFLGVVIVGAAVIIAASFANTWAGVAVAVIVFAGLVWWLRAGAGARRRRRTAPTRFGHTAG